MADICFVTTCKGRLDFLKQSLPTVLAQPDCACVVVDYSCPEGCGDWVEARHPQVKVVRVPGQPGYRAAHARNTGLRACQEPWVCLFDCDILFDPSFAQALRSLTRPGNFYWGQPLVDPGTWGTVVSQRADLERVGGYDEVYEGWGEEDRDLYASLEFIGVKRRGYPSRLVRHLPHEDRLRTQFYETKNRWLNNTINLTYRTIKFDLMRLGGKFLPRPAREQIYRSVRDVAGKALPAGTTADIKIDLEPFKLITGWGLHRSVSYTLRPDPVRSQ